MKLFSKILNTLLAFVVLGTLVAAIGSAITQKPVLLTVIRSNSMYPVWERGDMVFIVNLKENDKIINEDIIFFKTEEGSLAKKGWIAHRVVSGNLEKGFITKGDANDYTDQDLENSVPIQREWIAGKSFMIGESPLGIPKIGYLSLWAEKYQGNPYLLPVIALILAIIIAIGEMKAGKKRHKKGHGVDLQLIYFIGGFTISIIMGGTMAASGQNLKLSYEISKDTQGILMGSNVGILQIGDEVTNPLSDLSNDGIIPSIGVITTEDEQINLSHENLYLTKGQEINSTYTLNAEKIGKYDSSIRIAIFFPFLPSSLIYFLAQKSYWLTIVLVSLVPGLPLMLYPVFDGKMRRKTIKLIKKKTRKLQSILP